MIGPGFAVVAVAMATGRFRCRSTRSWAWWAFVRPRIHEPRGTVSIRSPDPSVAPEIDHHYRDVLGSGVFTTAWRDFSNLRETAAWRRRGASGGDLSMDDALAQRLGTAFHPSSSCAIGAVVDAELAVLGVDRLWVADASVFPANTTNNPNLTCLMVGDRVGAVRRPRSEPIASSAAAASSAGNGG